MPRLFHRFPGWWVALLAAGCGLLAGLWLCREPLERWIRQRWNGGVAAEVAGQSITRQELAEALRQQLWQRDLAWDSLDEGERRRLRQEVLEHLIDDRLVRASRLKDAPGGAPPGPAARSEAEMMQRQFAETDEAPRRMALQHLTPRALTERIEAAQRDEAWISAQIQPEVAKITQQVARAWYDRHPDALRQPQAWHAAHLFLAQAEPGSPDRAAEIRGLQQQMLAGKSTFAQLVVAHSEDDRSKKLGGDLGWFTTARMPADFIAAVRGLRVGEISGPVRTRLGWHLILLKEQRAPRLPAFEEVREEIRAMLTTERRESAVKELLAALRKRSQVLAHDDVITATEPAR